MKKIYKNNLEKLPVLYRLNEKELNIIANNIRLSRHAEEQVMKRMGINIRNLRDRNYFKDQIRNSQLAYVNTDGCINIAFTENTYIVVTQRKIPMYLVVTYKEPSKNSYTVRQKYKFALSGICRK